MLLGHGKTLVSRPNPKEASIHQELLRFCKLSSNDLQSPSFDPEPLPMKCQVLLLLYSVHMKA